MYHIIINPASRSGRSIQIWKKIIKPALAEKRIRYKAYLSKRPGDVKRIAKKISDSVAEGDFCRIIILGGDGTVNEALQGIRDFSRVVIGYIPTGSSNDLARDMGILKNPLHALERILAASNPSGKNCGVRLMDSGLVTFGTDSRHFVVSCGIGFDAAVCEETMHSKVKVFLNRLKLGKLTYLGIGIKQIFTAKKASCNLYLDGRGPIHVEKLLFAAAMIHRFEGGGFRFCPSADDRDGILDLCVAGNLSAAVILLALPASFFGWHFIFPGITHYRAKRVRIETSTPLWLHTDGEIHGKFSSLEISCRQKNVCFFQNL